MALRLNIAPSVEPITLAEAKAHLRVDGDEEDTLIGSLITAARTDAEAFTRRTFITTSWKLTLDSFPAMILLARPPVQSVTSIAYNDDAGAAQTLDAADYTLDKESEPARVIPAYGETWPTVYGHIADVTVLYKAGYGLSAADVPEPIRQAIKLMLGHLFEHRESITDGFAMHEVPEAAKSLLWPYRILTEI